MRRAAALAAAAAAAVALAGCGSTSEPSKTVVTVVREQPAATPPPTKTVVTVVKEAPAAKQATPAVDRQPAAKPKPKPKPVVTTPNIVGERLDVAEVDLRDRHLRYRELGGGTFGIVVPSNWTVCEQRPAAGTQNPGRVTVIVDREC
jgi:ABC-type glycerol-3-phosphate transport system substrate-binding protein